ncbi:hypothetical protein TNCV_3738321 [Trichonephila clavipes]|nr:hypothetical protein TNCV_3738321 [Trichonephila clavipes]
MEGSKNSSPLPSQCVKENPLQDKVTVNNLGRGKIGGKNRENRLSSPDDLASSSNWNSEPIPKFFLKFKKAPLLSKSP